jgi:hypothetical protein
MHFPRVVLGSDLTRPWAHLIVSWRLQLGDWFNSYRPEKHYMRGPGPKYREKQIAVR